MKVEYYKQTLGTPNPIARFAHKKRYELSILKVLQILDKNQTLLDYGCGKGDFLNKISALRKEAKLYGYDPESGHSSENYNITTKTDDIENASIDVFCTFETLEHLYRDEREKLYAEANRVLKNSGTIVISVPIIGGPTLILKEINRMILFKRKSEYSWKELFFSSFLGIPAKRPDNPRPSHKGFNFREIEKQLRLHFIVREKYYSPFSILPWFMNSQVFYVCSKR